MGILLITRYAQIIIRMIGEEYSSGTLILIQNVTFGTHSFILKKIHTPKFGISKSIFSLFPGIVFRRKGIHFIRLLVSSKCVCDVSIKGIRIGGFTINTDQFGIIRSTADFHNNSTSIRIAHLYGIKKRFACLILQGRRTTVPKESTHIGFFIFIKVERGNVHRVTDGHGITLGIESGNCTFGNDTEITIGKSISSSVASGTRLSGRFRKLGILKNEFT